LAECEFIKGKDFLPNHLMKNFWLTLVGTVVIEIWASQQRFTIAISLFTAATATPRFYYSVTDLGNLGGFNSWVAPQ